MTAFTLLSYEATARRNFEFSLGNKIQILSDKAIKHPKKERLDAIGNVIITYQNGAIYGDKAIISFQDGEAIVTGNVRYVTPDMTLYGRQLQYNFKTKTFSIKNGRILANNYVVIGKEITRVSKDVLIGIDTEYTTCKDCPESWSIVGQKIHITLGQYVRIWKAYIKVKGVASIYIPYIIFPIKKKRETGLLFPKFGFKVNEGTQLQWPWFWAITDHTDMTLTPSTWGNRGLGNKLQFRQILGEGKWYEFNSLQSYDRIYNPNQNTQSLLGEGVFRHISDYEQHYTDGRYINHHLHYVTAKDMDSIHDFDSYTNKRIKGSELGGGGFLDLRTSFAGVGIESYFNQNMLFPDAEGLDHRYVQMLPKLNLFVAPLQPFPVSFLGLNKISVGLIGDVTRFKQNHIDESSFIRNAVRFNGTPSLNWQIGRLGPLSFHTEAIFDYQHYRFPHLTKERTFSKSSTIHKSQAKMVLEKVFGKAVREEIPYSNIKRNKEKNEKTKDTEESRLIGKLPPWEPIDSEKKLTVVKHAYKHSQEISLKHYYLSGGREKGNVRWENQIKKEGGEGRFDRVDTIRRQEHNNLSSRTSLPLGNTLEWQWQHSVIKKSPKTTFSKSDKDYLEEHFTYQKTTYFNVSQGYNLNEESQKLRKRLTRLLVSTGLNLKFGRIGIREYYFYDVQKHLLQFDGGLKFKNFSLDLRFHNDPFSHPREKRVRLKGNFKASDWAIFDVSYDYDIEHKIGLQQLYKFLYTPSNQCWRMEVAWNRTVLEKKVSFNFWINFNDNNFKSLSDSF